MARRHVVRGYALLTSADLSTTLTSATTNVTSTDKASIIVEWSGTSGTATVTVEARNSDKDSWVTLSFGSAITISGASGDHQLILNETPFEEVRLIVTPSGSTGSVSARLQMNSVGA